MKYSQFTDRIKVGGHAFRAVVTIVERDDTMMQELTFSEIELVDGAGAKEVVHTVAVIIENIAAAVAELTK